MTIARKIGFLDRAILSIRQNIPPDPLAGLSARHKKMIEKFREQTPPLAQFRNMIDDTSSPESLISDSIGLPVEATAMDAQAFYMDMISKMKAHQSRRKKVLR